MNTSGSMKSFLLQTLLLLFVIEMIKGVPASSEFEASSGNREARQRPVLKITCLKPGFISHPNPKFTNRYILCVKIRQRWYYYIFRCPPGSTFAPDRGLCVIGIPDDSTGAPSTTTSGGDTSSSSSSGTGSTNSASSTTSSDSSSASTVASTSSSTEASSSSTVTTTETTTTTLADENGNGRSV